MVQNRFPEGWDEQRVRKVLKHYEDRTESMVQVPVELVPAVRELIAKHKR